MERIKLVATDLDGTFLRDDHSISPRNLEALHRLGERNIVRVAATGRNLKKVREVINEHVPFDFVVFSSGAGVFNWRNNEHVFMQNIAKESATNLMQYFIQQGLNFHAFYPIPENHKHYFFRGNEACEEFERYFNFNRAHSAEIDRDSVPESELCQFLLIIRENTTEFLQIKEQIETMCPEIRVIRTSSPITNGYIWIEIFHKSVSKGNGVNEICKRIGISKEETLGLGNDYNDFDLLEFTALSFLTGNAPDEIKTRFPLLPTNENDAFAFSVDHLIR
jgi:Cof subfamily protein (haloacid dehalogenase superfamily)